MRFKTINKNKPFYEAVTIKNGEASSSIPLGTPVIYAMNGTDDGLSVILPSSSTAVKATNLCAGLCATPNLATGQIGDAIIDGLCLNALYSRGTRSATTAAWPSFVAIALGDQLVIDTVANALVLSAVGAQAATPAAFVMADSSQIAASTTTAASNAYTQWAGQTNATILMKVLIRNM